MTETPDTIHGRMKEGAHLAGYSLQRSIENMRWLLEDSRFKELAAGYKNVNEFLRDTDGAFSLVNIKPEERKQIAELIKDLQPKASQRAIGDLVGVSPMSVGRDLRQSETVTNVTNEDNIQGDADGETVTNVTITPPAIPPDDYDPIEKERERQQEETLPLTASSDNPHVSNNSGNNEWYTPKEYIDAAVKVMGGINLDPASSEEANKVVMADVIYTIEDDGLSKQWAGRVWMNPPYASGLVEKFTSKLTGHFDGGDIVESIVLVNNATETKWFQDMLGYASAVCFPKRRVKFWGPSGNTGAPLQGQALVYLGQQVGPFWDVFSDFGAVLYV